MSETTTTEHDQRQPMPAPLSPLVHAVQTIEHAARPAVDAHRVAAAVRAAILDTGTDRDAVITALNALATTDADCVAAALAAVEHNLRIGHPIAPVTVAEVVAQRRRGSKAGKRAA